MIEAGRPLRQFEIVELSGMSKTRIHNNLNIMISKGLILMTEDINNKYYYPQPFFLQQGLLEMLYGQMLPFIKGIVENIDYSQLEIDIKESALENTQMLIKLFQFDIDDMKNEI
ncbi:MAG: helix-turn-helix domain-containing protein [Candidatus Lokiarchaeia archaeon]